MYKLTRILTIAIFAVVGLASISTADELDDHAIARYKEIVSMVNTDWVSTGNPVDLAGAARAAIRGGNYSRPVQGSRGADDLGILIRAEANRKGHRAAQIAEQAAATLVRSLDPWSSYMNAAEWRQYQKSLNPQFCGVGMDIERERGGDYTCWPYPGSAAEAAGIAQGAKLKSVNGLPATGYSLYSIISQVRGPSGQPVSIVFSNGFLTKTVSITRRSTKAQTVFRYQGKSGPGIRISHFSTDTAREFMSALRQIKGAELEIDLRDCRGGDLDEATACTGAFLPKGTLVAMIQRKKGNPEKLVSPGGQIVNASKVILLQNDKTASAAEFFIQALTTHGKARSFGDVSTGKGTTQSVIELSKGGAIILTTGVILGPGSSQSWHGIGLRPTR